MARAAQATPSQGGKAHRPDVSWRKGPQYERQTEERETYLVEFVRFLCAKGQFRIFSHASRFQPRGCGIAVHGDAQSVSEPGRRATGKAGLDHGCSWDKGDRKSTRLNSSH